MFMVIAADLLALSAFDRQIEPGRRRSKKKGT
jgi:hypothetical protein